MSSELEQPEPQQTEDYGYHATLYIGSCVVKLESNGDFIPLTGQLTDKQLAAVAIINEILHRMRHGKDLLPYVPQKDSFTANTIMRCKWQKSGILKVIGDNADKPLFNMVKSVDAAMQAKGVFCCSSDLIPSLPKRRIAEKVKELE